MSKRESIKESNKSNNKEKVWGWICENSIVCLYAVFACFIEMVSVFAVEKNPFISAPFIILGILMIVVGIVLLIKKNLIRFIVCTILLAAQAVLGLVFAVIYDMTGQYFDYGMLKLRNDAFGILEGIPMNFITFYSAMFFCVFFIIFSLRFIRRNKEVEVSKVQKAASIITIIAGALVSMIFIYITDSNSVDKYEDMLYNHKKGNYSSLGVTGNLINEFAKGLVFDDMETMSSKKINKYIYAEESEPTEYFGVSKGNNVVMVLVESFEWFSFIENSEEYPNGLNISQEEIEELFPNITKFYNESVVESNFHSKEKTDISESISILGSYPTDSYINYDYPENTLPYTVPNILRQEYGDDITINSFHDGWKTFYNRDKTHKIFGFEKLTDMYDMYDMSDSRLAAGEISEPTMHDYFAEGERNLDSEMINTCKDEMFPTDKQFYTYITTITMHGLYYERENLKENREAIEKVFKPEGTDAEMDETFINYLSTVKEFDTALGIMMNDLDEKGLLDNTTIVLFGDHNSYYSNLSNYVKDINDYNTTQYYPDLYKVPYMIYDQNLGHQVVDKFACTSDIVPTLLDILGIKYYSNMYYGHSIFSDEESVLYSRAYGFFLGEGILGKSLKSIYYKADSVTSAYEKDFDKRAKQLVKKIKYCDQIFYQDYFAKTKNYDKYTSKMAELNGWS